MVSASQAGTWGWKLYGLTASRSLTIKTIRPARKAIEYGEAAPTVWAYIYDAQLWFESFQNWQSELLSTAALVVTYGFDRFEGLPLLRDGDCPAAPAAVPGEPRR